MKSKETELRAIFDNLPLGIAYLDDQYKFIRINKFFTKLTGMRQEDLTGRPCYETVGEYADDSTKTGEEKICSFCKKEGCFQTKNPAVIERPLKDKFLRVTTIPQLDEHGETHHLLELFEDITESRQAEEALRKSEREFRRLSQEYHTLLDAIHNSIFLLSPDLKVLWANRGASDKMGNGAPDLKGRYCYDLLKHAGGPCQDCHALECFRTGNPVSAEVSFPDGQIWEASAFPIRDDEGRVNKVIMIYRDITSKIKLRAETMRASHLACLGELAAGVAHEINNPINGIINYAQIIADKNSSGKREHDMADGIIEEGRRIAGIVSSLLSFAREQKKEKIPVSIHKILSDTLALSQTLLEKNGVHLKTDLPLDLPPIFANPHQIQQVFLNIINNALYALNQKYPGTDEDKRLEIIGEPISRDGRSYLRMTFYDRGTGIPATLLGKVVQPFFSTKPAGQGTGLGLSISHGIIGDHDGRMGFESEEGAFTKVIIDLPAVIDRNSFTGEAADKS